MDKFDFKKADRKLYAPKDEPSSITVPTMRFFAVDGRGNPNEEGGAYQKAVELLYALSYAVKMNKTRVPSADYVVAPLESLWSIDGGQFGGDKGRFCWTALIRQPDFIDSALADWAFFEVRRKKPHLAVETSRFEDFTEGLCVQCLHTGSYDNEPATIAKMETFMARCGFGCDVSASRRHHELYLSDPRKTAAEKIKTIIRIPVRKI